jgi:hypothetical protein
VLRFPNAMIAVRPQNVFEMIMAYAKARSR